MPPNLARTANSPNSAARSSWLIAGATILAAGFFLSGLGNEPFADEYAYITQAYFVDLLADGKINDPAWLEFPAYDLPPLPKYLIGLSLHAAGIPLPGREAAYAWYRDINRKFGSPETLIVARIPSALLGAFGCLAIYGLGCLALDRRAGLLAFLLLMVNPLYGLHARRAMSDVPCEAFILASLVCGLWAWLVVLRGRWWSVSAWSCYGLAGVFAGLALLCKFNGLLAVMVISAWASLGLLLRERGALPKAALVVGAGVVASLSFSVFVGLNPFMLAHAGENPNAEALMVDRMSTWERFRFQMRHRTDTSEGQQKLFPHNALVSPIEKFKVVATQGFGRFGLFGKRGWSSAEKSSEQRYEWNQDWGAAIWGPLVICGFVALLIHGNRQFQIRELPTSWTIAAWAIVTFGVVTVYIPMAWDRYLMPIQSVSCLMVAMLLSLVWDQLRRIRRPKTELEVSEV